MMCMWVSVMYCGLVPADQEFTLYSSARTATNLPHSMMCVWLLPWKLWQLSVYSFVSQVVSVGVSNVLWFGLT